LALHQPGAALAWLEAVWRLEAIASDVTGDPT